MELYMKIDIGYRFLVVRNDGLLCFYCYVCICRYELCILSKAHIRHYLLIHIFIINTLLHQNKCLGCERNKKRLKHEDVYIRSVKFFLNLRIYRGYGQRLK